MGSKKAEPPKIQPDAQSTSEKGLGGIFEWLMRRFSLAVHMSAMLPLYGLSALVIGAAITPAAFFLRWAWLASDGLETLWRVPAMSVAAAGGFFIGGFSLLTVIPIVNFFCGSGLKAWRGPYFSLPVVRWYVHNGLTYIARYTFLEFVTPTPFNVLFYRAMGMKIGDGVQLNTTNISDPSMISIGHKATIGGSATLLAHYGMGGFLVIAPVSIGDGATIGLRATVMGGCEIGEGAKIMPNSVVLPRTKVPAGETWGGVPARKIELKRKKAA